MIKPQQQLSSDDNLSPRNFFRVSILLELLQSKEHYYNSTLTPHYLDHIWTSKKSPVFLHSFILSTGVSSHRLIIWHPLPLSEDAGQDRELINSSGTSKHTIKLHNCFNCRRSIGMTRARAQFESIIPWVVAAVFPCFTLIKVIQDRVWPRSVLKQLKIISKSASTHSHTQPNQRHTAHSIGSIAFNWSSCCLSRCVCLAIWCLVITNANWLIAGRWSECVCVFEIMHTNTHTFIDVPFGRRSCCCSTQTPAKLIEAVWIEWRSQQQPRVSQSVSEMSRLKIDAWHALRIIEYKVITMQLVELQESVVGHTVALLRLAISKRRRGGGGNGGKKR